MSILIIGEISEARIRRCLDEVEEIFEKGAFYEANWLLDSVMISTLVEKQFLDKEADIPTDLDQQIQKVNLMAQTLGSKFVISYNAN